MNLRTQRIVELPIFPIKNAEVIGQVEKIQIPFSKTLS